MQPPGGFQPNVSAPPRLPLSLMDDAEFVAWQAQTIGALEQDLVLYADLLDVLRELGAQRIGGTSSHSGNTGLLLMAEYDDRTPRPKP